MSALLFSSNTPRFPYLCPLKMHPRFYTRKVNILMELGMAGFVNSDSGQFWLAVEGYHTWLMAKDLLGTKNATTLMSLPKLKSSTQAFVVRWAERSSLAAVSATNTTGSLSVCGTIMSVVPDKSCILCQSWVELRRS